MLDPMWQLEFDSASKLCELEKDTLSLKKAIDILEANFSQTESATIFVGPDRCEVLWSNDDQFIVFSESDTAAFRLNRETNRVFSVSLSDLHPPLFCQDE
jgi:hypothetical protein